MIIFFLLNIFYSVITKNKLKNDNDINIGTKHPELDEENPVVL